MADPPVLGVPATITAEPPGPVALPIRVGAEPALPRNSFVTIRGLPAAAALSDGHAIGPGSWAVPINALAGLRVHLPIGLAGRADVRITLLTTDGATLSEARTVLLIGRSAAAAGASPAEPAATDSQRPALLPQDRERALKLLKKGDEELNAGLVVQARLLYERAAELGLAQAAMALAATYDAAELNRPHLRALVPDAAEARRWYERAQQLGAREADARLRRLSTR